MNEWKVNEWKVHLALTAPNSQCRGEWLEVVYILLYLAAQFLLTHSDFLEQGPRSIFCKGPHNKYFWFLPYSVCHSYLVLDIVA